MPTHRNRTRSASSSRRHNTKRDGQRGKRTTISRLLTATNDVRAEHDRHPLELSERLCNAIDGHVHELAHFQRHLSHKGLDGSDKMQRMKDAGFDVEYCHENLGRNQRTPEHVVSSWMKSPSHRKCMLTPRAERVGFAVAENKSGETYWGMDVATEKNTRKQRGSYDRRDRW